MAVRWLENLVHGITWLHVTRFVGIVALLYEVAVEQVDKPSLMIVIGAMILGTEAFSMGRRNKGGNGDQ